MLYSFYPSFYGSFRTRKLSEIWPNVSEFSSYYQTCGIPTILFSSSEYNNYNINTIYALIMGRYGFSNIKSANEDQFKLRFMTVLFEYGKTWQKKMIINEKFLTMSEKEILTGSKALYNHARNPAISPSTATLEELPYIDDQNTTSYLRDPKQAYMETMENVNARATEEFLNKFKHLFIEITAPDGPLYYVEEDD